MKTGLKIQRKAGTVAKDFTPAMLAWSLEQMGPVATDPVPGDGTEVRPFRMSTIGQWAQAAATQTAKGKDLYVIGGHIIERNPAGEYADYMTDVIDAVPMIGEPVTGHSTVNRPRSFMSPDRKDPLPIYRQKYERMDKSHLDLDNRQLARQARQLLKGAQDMSIFRTLELPGTLAAVFLAEVYRERRMLPIGLMLLDLVEVGVSYGTGTETPQKVYTWEKLMSNPGNKKDRISGGKHPMLHDQTQTQASQMFNAFNPVTKKSISILVAWLHCYLKSDPQWSTWVVRNSIGSKDTLGPKKFQQIGISMSDSASRGLDPATLRDNPYDFYNSAVKAALDHRCQTLDCLLTSNTLSYFQG